MPIDLVLLAAESNIEHGMRDVLSRPEALGIRPVRFKTYRHPQRDPGCANRAHDFLRQFCRDYDHALVVFDHEGSGCEHLAPERLEADVTQRLAANGWGDRAATIVVFPELEVWVFGTSPELEQSLRWRNSTPLRAWLQNRGVWDAGHAKPADPKRALESALREARQPRSSSFYESLAGSVDLTQCQHPAFRRFREALIEWFPAT